MAQNKPLICKNEMKQQNALAEIERAGLLISNAETLDQTFIIRGLLREAELKARKQGLMELEIRAMEYRHWLTDKMGEILKQMKEKGEIAKGGESYRKSGRHGFNPSPESPNRFEHDVKGRFKATVTHPSKKSTGDLNTENKTLRERGVSKNESSQAQKYHGLPEEKKKEVIEREKQRILKSHAITETHSRPEPGPLPEGEFNVILADPPWEYDYQKRGSPNKHYPTMSLEEIRELGKKIPSSQDSILFLWAPAPKLREALEVMETWNFEYKTNAAWVKNRLGTGYYLRGKHELLLIGTKGKPGTPLPKDRPPSVFEAPRGEHSEKPGRAFEIIERMYPKGKFLELFHRGDKREGWNAWGAE